MAKDKYGIYAEELDDNDGKNSKPKNSVGGYMQGIAAIGNALNDTHGNVLDTLKWMQNWGKNVDPRDMYQLEKDKLREQKRQFNEGTRRHLNQSGIGILQAQRDRAQIGANRRSFKDAITNAITNGA